MFYRALATLLTLTSFAFAIPTLYLVGDSTMATRRRTDIQGWGKFISNYLDGLNIVNKAIAGRSARSYTREGRWSEIQGLLNAGDYVIIEFGHNEVGTPADSDRASVPGEGEDTQTVTLPNRTVEVVHTWPHYIKAMIDGAKSKGATPIISSQTPINPYANSDTVINAPTPWVGYANRVAAAKGVPYVDHFAATMQVYAKLGKKEVDSFYPHDNDNTHTSPTGAENVAYAFISGLKCPVAQGVLSAYINSYGASAGRRCQYNVYSIQGHNH